MFLFHFNCPWSFICQRIQTLNQTLTQSLFFLVKSFTELLKLVNRVKLHGTLICWIEDVLEHLCKSTSIFKFNQIAIKFQLPSFLFFFFFFSFLSSQLCFVFCFDSFFVVMFAISFFFMFTFLVGFSIFLNVFTIVFKKQLIKLGLSGLSVIVLSHGSIHQLFQKNRLVVGKFVFVFVINILLNVYTCLIFMV